MNRKIQFVISVGVMALGAVTAYVGNEGLPLGVGVVGALIGFFWFATVFVNAVTE